MKRIAVLILIAAVMVVMLAAGALVIFDPSSSRSAERVAYATPIQIDDFAYAALSSERVNALEALEPEGVFYVVELQVANHAKRVGYTFRPETVMLVDAAGTEYSVSEEARRAWFAIHRKTDECAHELVPGETCTTTLVYDTPPETNAPYLKLSFAGKLFEVADAVLYGNRVMQLK